MTKIVLKQGFILLITNLYAFIKKNIIVRVLNTDYTCLLRISSAVFSALALALTPPTQATAVALNPLGYMVQT